MFGLIFGGNFLFALQESSFSGGVQILASHIERDKERIFATGNVEIHYTNIKIFADSIELNTETKDVFARGNVVIQLPDEQLSVEEIQANLDSMQGKFQRGFGLVRPNVRYEAETIERKEANIYSLRKASITSCTQTVPRWKFSCSKANFKKNDYIEMWNSVLSIKKIPVFYFPYMRYPLGEEKSTGFLMPRFGFSGPKGMFFSEGFYWALKRNMDATINFDYYSARGLGGALEYRYLFSQGTGGQLNLYYFFFKDDPEREDLSNAYIFRFYHNQPLPFDLALVANVDFQSSFDFLREFDNNFRSAIVSNRRSEIFLSRSWSLFNFNMRASRFETHFVQIGSSIIRKSLPTIDFFFWGVKLFTPLYFSFTSSFDRWEQGWEWDFLAGSQLRSQDLKLSPELTFPVNVIPWLTLNSTFTTNLDYHFQTYAPNTSRIVDEPMLSHKYTFNTELIGPVFYKIYYGAQGEAKAKHIIEPSITYRYQTPITNLERIITPEDIYRDHYIHYELTNRLLIRQDEMPRELLTLGVGQDFYPTPEESPFNISSGGSEIHKFSGIGGYIRFYPSAKYNLNFSTSFDPYLKTFTNFRLGADLGQPGDRMFLNLNWYKFIHPEIKTWNRHQIGCRVGLNIPQISLKVLSYIDYNIQERKMLYSELALTYQYQCLDFRVELRAFYFREKPETQFRISFGLGNIGKTTDFMGGAEF